MTKHSENYRDTKSNDKRKRKQAYGNPIASHSVAGTSCEPLKPWERWEKRPVIMSSAYDKWGQK